ncbi:hypothetical protein EDD86DRAFT_246096 [Gorgonomyces haynaldii]|nr:hypothetical protein EDD86DRAFT_246096 [Gorgonomyces haynaldii]
MIYNPCTLNGKLEPFFVTGKYADAILRITVQGSDQGQLDIPVHRIILSAASPVFNALFSKTPLSQSRFNNGDSPLTLVSVWNFQVQEPQAMRLLLEYIYFGKCDMDKVCCWYLLSLARSAQMDQLERETSNWIVNNLFHDTSMPDSAWCDFLLTSLDANCPTDFVTALIDAAVAVYSDWQWLMQQAQVESRRSSFMRYLLLRQVISSKKWNDPMSQSDIDKLLQSVDCQDWNEEELECAKKDGYLKPERLVQPKVKPVIIQMADTPPELSDKQPSDDDKSRTLKPTAEDKTKTSEYQMFKKSSSTLSFQSPAATMSHTPEILAPVPLKDQKTEFSLNTPLHERTETEKTESVAESEAELEIKEIQTQLKAMLEEEPMMIKPSTPELLNQVQEKLQRISMDAQPVIPKQVMPARNHTIGGTRSQVFDKSATFRSLKPANPLPQPTADRFGTRPAPDMPDFNYDYSNKSKTLKPKTALEKFKQVRQSQSFSHLRGTRNLDLEKQGPQAQYVQGQIDQRYTIEPVSPENNDAWSASSLVGKRRSFLDFVKSIL